MRQYDPRKIDALLDEHDMSIADLADRLDMHRSTLWLIRTGQRPFRRLHAIAIASILDVPVERLAYEEELAGV